jgi:hypothetical protein
MNHLLLFQALLVPYFIINTYYYLYIKLKMIFKVNIKKKFRKWGLGIGDWGLGPIPNPQSPIPNPQSPFPEIYIFYLIFELKYNIIYYVL